MNELIKTDVGEFFVSHTKNFDKNPPDSMWESIERHIPEYSVSAINRVLLKYLISGISLSAIIIAALLFYFQNKQNNNNENLSSKNNVSNQQIANNLSQTNNLNVLPTPEKNAHNTKSIITESKKQKNIEPTSNKTTVNTATKPANTNTQTTPELDKSIKYSINATTFKNVSEIFFENVKNENVIDLKNPVPNAFGFYEIDISKLSAGTYNIWVISNGNKTLHKTETFK